MAVVVTSSVAELFHRVTLLRERAVTAGVVEPGESDRLARRNSGQPARTPYLSFQVTGGCHQSVALHDQGQRSLAAMSAPWLDRLVGSGPVRALSNPARAHARSCSHRSRRSGREGAGTPVGAGMRPA